MLQRRMPSGDGTMHHVPDERLVSLASADNRDAFDELVRRYRPLALRTAAQIAGPDRAEDAVQDAFLLAYRALATLQDGAKFSRWLSTITRFRALRLVQAESRRRTETVGLEAIPMAKLSASACAPRASETRDEQLRQALAAIPPVYAEVIRLHFLNGLPHQQIAEFLAAPVATVRWRCFRGKELLRSLLSSADTVSARLETACTTCPDASTCRGHRVAHHGPTGSNKLPLLCLSLEKP